MASIGESDGNSDYVKSAKNSPTSLANTPDLAGNTSELEEIHKVVEAKLVKLAQPTVFFSRMDGPKIIEFDDADNDLPENHQENGATPPVNTQPYSPQSPQEDTLVASAAPPPYSGVEAGNAALQARWGELLYVHLFGADYMLYGVCQGWVHQNLGDHLDGGIAEESKWQARRKTLVCIPTQHYYALSRKFGRRFVGILSVELDWVCARNWNAERVIVFQSVILQHAQGVNNSAQIRKRIFF